MNRISLPSPVSMLYKGMPWTDWQEQTKQNKAVSKVVRYFQYLSVEICVKSVRICGDLTN